MIEWAERLLVAPQHGLDAVETAEKFGALPSGTFTLLSHIDGYTRFLQYQYHKHDDESVVAAQMGFWKMSLLLYSFLISTGSIGANPNWDEDCYSNGGSLCQINARWLELRGWTVAGFRGVAVAQQVDGLYGLSLPLAASLVGNKGPDILFREYPVLFILSGDHDPCLLYDEFEYDLRI